MKLAISLAGWLAQASRLLCLALLITPSLAAESKSTSGNAPMLWRVEAKAVAGKAIAPSYLFGTIHIPDPRVTRLPAAVEQAFADSDVVVTELKLDTNTMAAAASASLLPANQSLLKLLSPALRQQLETELKAINPKLQIAMFERLKPWALATQLVMLPMQLKHPGEAALDIQLAERAEQAGKGTRGLEPLHEQLDVFEKLSKDEQLALLQDTLDGLAKARRQGKDVVELLTLAYLSGDETAVTSLLEEFEGGNTALNDKLEQSLLFDRNIRMAERLGKQIRAEPDRRFFVAVGTAHLIGERSVPALLRQQGFSVTRVPATAKP